MFSVMSLINFEVNEQIMGKAKAVKDQLGTIQSITGDGKKRKLTVLFADNKTRIMTVFGIKKFSHFEVQPNLTTTTDGPGDSNMHPNMFQDDDKSSASDSSEETDVLNQGFLQ